MVMYYKIVLKEGDHIRTLFHGINGSRILPFNKWIVGIKKMVKDASKSNTYLSGIHVFKFKTIATKYLKRFRTEKDRIIIRCFATGLRNKPSNIEVLLADQIFIPKQNI